MRGINRTEKQKVQDYFRQGLRPAEIVRLLKEQGIIIPLSTITTWYAELSPREKNLTKNGKKIVLHDMAREINSSEAKIMIEANSILNPDITDSVYFRFQKSLTEELQKLVYNVACKICAN